MRQAAADCLPFALERPQQAQRLWPVAPALTRWNAALRRCLLACLLLLCGREAFGQPTPTAAESCPPAIAAAERQDRLPPKLLDAIALVESGRPDPTTGRAAPWPWTINAEGIGRFFPTKADAIAAVRDLQALGVRSIDVGCLQINLMHHPNAFASMDEAFDPVANAAYGARFLEALYLQTGSWPQAAAAYHSQTPEIGQAYESRVMAIWPLASRFPDPGLRFRHATASPAIDYSKYTPAFAAKVRQMVEDRARLEARFGAALPLHTGVRVARHRPWRGLTTEAPRETRLTAPG